MLGWPIVPFLTHRHDRARVGAAMLVALTVLAGAGCGGSRDESGHRWASTERDIAGDVIDSRVVEQLDPDEWDEAALESTVTDRQPGLDLRRAELAVRGKTLRLNVETEGMIRAGTFTLTASTKASCVDTQLTVHIHVQGDSEATTVEATDHPDGRRRPVDAAVQVDGEHLTLTLPLLASARFEGWMVSSADTAPSRLDDSRYGDQIPDWIIQGAYFAEGRGTPNHVGRPGDGPCGPADPPLLAR